MLTFEKLVDLERALREKTVLSVYVNGTSSDPATRDRWSVDLRHSFDDIESWLRGSSHSEREAFAACREMALKELRALPPTRERGWTGFFTADGPSYVGTLPVPVQTLAAWSTGACVAPYIRALKENRPVIVTVVDRTQARIFRYVEGEVALVESFERKLIADQPYHMGHPPRVGFSSNTRGRTGTDAAQKEELSATNHMLAEIASRIGILAHDGAWIVVGGIPDVATAALRQLAPAAATRSMRAEHLDVHATEAQVAECARDSASKLRDADDLKRIEEAVSAAETGRAGAIGVMDTQKALDLAQVRELFITQKFLENHAADANGAVRRAMDEGAVVEHVSGEAAARLDALGGMAARLRYAPAREAALQGAPEP
jgi:hypothetical protein